MLLRPPVSVLLGQPEVDYVHQVPLLAQPHEKVIRLYVTMDEIPRMDEVGARYELISEQQDRLQGETPRAEVEEIFERRTQQFHHHDVVVAFRAAPFYLGYSH